ncbi:ferritin-like domain-containing protein [Nonomuraea sp. NPDC050310]|uniref:ferritin-like domain-containing protein n=1 Tax=Nonomuraea sp. NPDC050310 TaxID=3154935 RepID=UPI0033C3FDCB
MSRRLARDGAADVARLGKALAAEHAAVYAYGLLGARTTGALRSRVSAAFDAHRYRRDQLRSLLLARGGKAVETEASYDVPVTASATDAVNLAVRVEDGITAAYLELAACEELTLRRFAASAMQEAVTRSYGLRRQIKALPGMPEQPVTPAPSTSPGLGTDPSTGTG